MKKQKISQRNRSYKEDTNRNYRTKKEITKNLNYTENAQQESEDERTQS